MRVIGKMSGEAHIGNSGISMCTKLAATDDGCGNYCRFLANRAIKLFDRESF